MILKILRGGRIVCKSQDNSMMDISDRAIEYLFEGVELDQDVTLKDLFLILKGNPALLQVYRRLRVEELIDAAFTDHPETMLEYEKEDVEYIDLYWGMNFEQKGQEICIWPKMLVCGVGHALQGALEADSYGVFPVSARQRWSLECCSPSELLDSSIRIDSKISIQSDDNSQWLNLGLPCLGKVLEGVLYCLSWFGSEENRKQIFAEILEEGTESGFYKADADELLADLNRLIASAKEKMAKNESFRLGLLPV